MEIKSYQNYHVINLWELDVTALTDVMRYKITPPPTTSPQAREVAMMYFITKESAVIHLTLC
ncbi:MAG: hypothetical protein ACKPKT_16130 [Dolichospermum sp.]